MSLFLSTGILIASGLLAIKSAAPELFLQQVFWIAIGAAIVAAFYFFDWRKIISYRPAVFILYFFSIALLFAAHVFSPEVRGIKGWIFLGPLTFQPVELAKVSLVLLFANYFSRKHLLVSRPGTVLQSFSFFALPAILVIFQPDLGSAAILFGIWFSFLLASGFYGKRLLAAVFIFMLAAIFLWFNILEDYQKDRIIGVFYPERDILGINYSAAQSKIAIGSGGFWGKGFGQGTQTRLGFLTEPASDFIFAVIVEEWGLFGGIIIMFTTSLLIFSILKVAIFTRGNFEKFLCIGTSAVFGLQFLLNVGSATGLMPVVGVTFPFVSYGGSSVVVNFFLLALINAIKKER